MPELKAKEFRRLKAEVLDTAREHGRLWVREIAQLGSDEAAQFLAEIWDTPLTSNKNERSSLINAAREHGGDACVPMLEKALALPPSLHHEATAAKRMDRVRQINAMETLVEIQGRAALPMLTRLSKEHPSAVFRTYIGGEIVPWAEELIARTESEAEDMPEHCAVVRAIVRWGQSRDSEPCIRQGVVYLLKDNYPASLEDESLRLYSMTELTLLSRLRGAHAIWPTELMGEAATAILKPAMYCPDSHVSWNDSCGWKLSLRKKNGIWSVSKAVEENWCRPRSSRGWLGASVVVAGLALGTWLILRRRRAGRAIKASGK